MRRIVWLTPARRERADIARRIRQDNPAAARWVIAEIKTQTSRLADLSFIGRPGRVPETRELSINRTPYLVIDRVQHVADLLGDNPMIGVARGDLRPGLRSFAVGNHLMFFTPSEEGVIIARVIDGRRDYPELFDEPD